jgi:hypothetical protein
MLLILGSIYTVLHKIALGIFPVLGYSEPGKSITAILWLAASFTLVVFAYRFLKDVSPRGRTIRWSLVSIMAFTGVIMIARLPFGLVPFHGTAQRAIFGAARLLNSLAMLGFLVSCTRVVPADSVLRRPVRAAAWTSGAAAALRIVSGGYFANFLLTGREVAAPLFVWLVSMLVFAIAYGASLWFLVKLRTLESYAELARG